MLPKKPKKHIYSIGVECSRDEENQVKLFCRLTGQTISKFACEALLNEVDYQKGKLAGDKGKAIVDLLAIEQKQPL